MGDEVLKVQMLGRFTMTYGDMPVSLKKISSAKSVRLLQMLLLSGENGISKNELMDSLYGWSGSSDGANRNRNLNNLIYRLKGQLAAAGMPEDEYVVIREGICYWKSRMRLELDTQNFQKLVDQARQAGGEERLRLYLLANESYFGDLLPAHASEMWFYEKSNFFKELYVETIRELDAMYHSRNDQKSLLSVYERAASVYPFDNWQIGQIRCYLELYRFDEARAVYERTMELYAKELEHPSIEEMQRCFEQFDDKNGGMRNRGAGGDRGIQTIDQAFQEQKEQIARDIFDQNSQIGTFYCSYPSFVDYCRLVARNMGRYDFTSVMMFLTLTQEERGTGGRDTLGRQMEILKHAIRSSLRSGDAFTRYGSCHYILMLIHLEKEDCSGIFSRIESAYNRVSGSRGELWYQAFMTWELE